VECGTPFRKIMERRGYTPILYVPIIDGTRSKCDWNDVPGTMLWNEERDPYYLVFF
jgi:hypothetical protein